MTTTTFDVSDLIFEDPPEIDKRGPRFRTLNYATWLAYLRQHPGRWARHPARLTGATAGGKANRIMTGKVAGVLPGEFEAVSRTIDGQTYVFARYVGLPKP